ncbi:MAG TPA: cyanophycin synthetase, partial [Thermoanaerobaculia bacterium]
VAARADAGERVRVVWYGVAAEEDGEGGDDEARPVPAVRAADVRQAGGGETGSRFTLVVAGGNGEEGGAGGGSLEVHLPLHGEYNVANALAAAAAAWALGVPLDEIAAAAAEARPVTGRGAVHRLAGEVTIVDDSYNSNPEALKLALDSAAGLAGDGRRWAVLGDMLELGPEAPRFHRECGRHAAERGFAPVVGVGELSREIVAGAEEAGGDSRWFAAAAEAADFAAGEIAPGDVLLVKGSRGVGLDAVVQRLLEADG